MSIVVERAPVELGRILVVDDDPQVGRLLARILTEAGYEVTTVTSAAEAHLELRSGDVALLLADVNMPGESGIELVRHTAIERPNVATVMISGLDDPGVAEVALENGAYGYLTKPVRRSDVVIAVMNALRRRTLELFHRAERESLERVVAVRTASLQSTVERLDAATAQLARSRDETVRALARAVECRDLETGGHIERMSRYCGLLAARIGLDRESIQAASQMHDIGKIGVPDSILLKRGTLTADERRIMERHTVIGHDLLRDSTSELLKLGSVIALTHHERVDGLGYPARLTGDDIPIEGRVAAVADVFDALTTDRVYRSAISVPEAVAIMRSERGKHFDKDLLDPFLESLPDVIAIHAEIS
jgi:putative two-component system response regulator